MNVLTYEQLKQQLEAREREVMALTNECVQMKAIIDAVTDLDNEPQYHCEGMGCGLEDRGITDRYDAMQYGWEQAMERIYGEVIPCAEELSFPATDAALREIKAQGVEEFIVWATAPSGFDTDLTTDDAQEFADELRGRPGDGN